MAATTSSYSYNGNLLGEIHASTSFTTLTRSSSSRATATATATSSTGSGCTGEPLSLDLSEIPETAHTCDTFALIPQGGCSPYILTAVWDPNDGSDTVMIVEIASGIELNHSWAWFGEGRGQVIDDRIAMQQSADTTISYCALATPVPCNPRPLSRLATSPTNSTLSFRVQDASRNVYDSYTSLQTLILPPPVAGVVDPEWCLLTDTGYYTTPAVPSSTSTSTSTSTRAGTGSIATETSTVPDMLGAGEMYVVACLRTSGESSDWSD